MPNKCTHCGKIHPDEADYLLEGCDNCGSKFFFYIKDDSLKESEEDLKKLSKNQLREIEDDVREIIEKQQKESGEDVQKNETVVLDIEAINIKQPGKYEIDLTNLMNQRPLVIKVGSGKYKIDLSSLKFKWRKTAKR